MRAYFCTLYSIFLVSGSIFMPISHCFDCHSFVLSFEFREVWVPQLYYFFTRLFWLLGIQIPYEFRDVFSYFCKKCHWDFDKDFIVDCFGQYYLANNIKSSSPSTQMSFHLFTSCLISFNNVLQFYCTSLRSHWLNFLFILFIASI